MCAAARAWKGIRWRHQGRGERGVDCGGLVIRVAEECGYLPADFVDLKGYRRHPTRESLREVCEKFMDVIEVKEIEPGDVLLFKDLREGWPVHLGIVVDGEHRLGMVHSHAWHRPPQVVEVGLDESWMGYACGAFRYRGIA